MANQTAVGLLKRLRDLSKFSLIKQNYIMVLTPKKINVGIAGAAGYTAGELIRVLLNHPNVGQIYAQSESHSGRPIVSIHQDLLGETDRLFCLDLNRPDLDIIFLCKGHGKSKAYLDENPKLKELKIIDLSQDFRISGAHGFIYGLPEIYRESIRKADHIANPGCFATAIQLAILPAIAAQVIESDVHVSGITGSTGAGQALSPTLHYSWRNDNASIYKAFTHQHLEEIKQSSVQIDSNYDGTINFLPYRGAFTRGIIISAYFTTNLSEAALVSLYDDFYSDHPFTHTVAYNPDIKMVVNTNKALVSVSKMGNQALVIVVIDNLLKGASGQAVQNMNLIFDFEETT